MRSGKHSSISSRNALPARSRPHTRRSWGDSRRPQAEPFHGKPICPAEQVARKWHGRSTFQRGKLWNRVPWGISPNPRGNPMPSP
jgi:hypothetical protein